MLITEKSIDENGVLKAVVKNKSYYDVDDNMVDSVIAVYSDDGSMKDVFLQKDIAISKNGEYINITSDELDYSDGDTIKLFIFDSIEQLNPLLAENV